MRNLSFEQLGLTNLSSEELDRTNGGEWPKWLKGVTWAAIGNEIIENWDEIKKGLADGWNSLK